MDIQDFTLQLPNDQVPYRIFTPAGAGTEFCVLWLQGWSSSMDSHKEGVQRMSKASGLTFATMDIAGHGLHTQPLEESTRAQQHGEVVVVYDELAKRGYKKIIVIGGSFGAYQAALLAGKRPVQAAVLRAPANYPDSEFELPYNQTLGSQDSAAYANSMGVSDDLAQSMAVQAITGFAGTVYVLHHELDEEIPVQMSQAYFAAAKHSNYVLIPRTKHSPKFMKSPQAAFAYIEHVIVSILKAVQLEGAITE